MLRAPPKQCTARSTSGASSRAKYSTCTPAPPYTSGGYSRLKSAIFMAESLTNESQSDHVVFTEDHDAVVAEGEAAGAIFFWVDADASARRNLDVLVQDGAPNDRAATHVDAMHQDRVFDVR